MMDKTYNIVVATDDNYAPHTATLIESVGDTNSDIDIVFHILDSGISDNIKDKLNTLISKYSNINISFYSITHESIVERFGGNVYQDRSLSTYARIFIPEILPDNISKAIYMDVDAVVLGSLKECFDIDIAPYCIGGVRDVASLYNRDSVDLERDMLYINAGFILWDLNECRRQNFVDKVLSFIKNKEGNVVAMDQGSINGAMRGEIFLLPPKYNVLTNFFDLSAKHLNSIPQWKVFYTQEELNEAINTPIFVHFTPFYAKRPWFKSCRHPLKEKYLYYRNKTPFKLDKLDKLDKGRRPLKIRILAALYYSLPYSIYNLIFKVGYRCFTSKKIDK